jgi:hypothetical protein
MNVSGQLRVLATLPQGHNFLYTMNRKLSGPESQSQHFGGDEKYLAPARNQGQNHQTCLVTIPTELSCLPK